MSDSKSSEPMRAKHMNVEAELRRLTRRSFATGAAAALAGGSALAWLATRSTEDGVALAVAADAPIQRARRGIAFLFSVDLRRSFRQTKQSISASMAWWVLKSDRGPGLDGTRHRKGRPTNPIGRDQEPAFARDDDRA